MYKITDKETAKLLRQQLKGQARGCVCRTLQDEDYERPGILQKMMKNLEEAYTNFTFHEEDDVDVQEQPIDSKKKPQRKKAEEKRIRESTKENVCSCCWNEAKLPVEINNSTNTGCLMPTFNSCQFHQCRFPEMRAPKIVEEEDASKLQKEEESDEDERVEDKESKAETAEGRGCCTTRSE